MSPDLSPQREECPVTLNELDIAYYLLEHLELESWSCSRPAWESEATESPGCVWHTGRFEKSPNDLPTEVCIGELRGAIAPNTDLTSLELPPAPGLIDADLSAAYLINAGLPEADFREADLSEADLRGADFPGSYLNEVDLADITLARSTQITAPRDRIDQEFSDERVSTQAVEDVIARANHELRTAYSANVLISRARSARVREHKARRREARAEEGWRGTAAWAGSLLSRCSPATASN